MFVSWRPPRQVNEGETLKLKKLTKNYEKQPGMICAIIELEQEIL